MENNDLIVRLPQYASS